MKTILITGANGFIGSHLVEECQRRGFNVLAGVRPNSNLSNLDYVDVSFVFLDYENKTNLLNQLKSETFDYVIHVAGVTVAPSEQGYNNGNYTVTKNLIDAVKGKLIKKFIFVSSLAARGPGISKVDRPISPYGRSKLRAEKLLDNSGIPHLIVRPTAVYGPRNMEFIPLLKWANRGVIVNLGNINRKLTFIHVADLVQLIIEGLQSNRTMLYAYDGNIYSLAETNETIKEVLEKKQYVTLPIPAWLFRGTMTFLNFVVSKVLKKSWPYPPGKVKEFIALDWSIEEDVQCSKYDLKSGFLDMANSILFNSGTNH